MRRACRWSSPTGARRPTTPENTLAAFRRRQRARAPTGSSSTSGAPPTAPWSSTTTPRCADGRAIVRRRRGASCPPTVPLAGRGARRLRRHGGERRDQELARRARTSTPTERPPVGRLVAAVRARRRGRRRCSSRRFDLADARRASGPLDPALADRRYLVLDARRPGRRRRPRGRRPATARCNPWDPFVDAALVAAAHDAGLAVNAWTVDDPDRIAELAGLGRRRHRAPTSPTSPASGRRRAAQRRLRHEPSAAPPHGSTRRMHVRARGGSSSCVDLAEVVAVDLVGERAVARRPRRASRSAR